MEKLNAKAFSLGSHFKP